MSLTANNVSLPASPSMSPTLRHVMSMSVVTSSPSSPTSVRSSSSAIFERDIEALSTSNPSIRSRDDGVPSVLCAAATALQDHTSSKDNIQVIAPAIQPDIANIFFQSRSPSPVVGFRNMSIQEIPEPPTPSSAYFSLAASEGVDTDNDADDYESSILAPTIATQTAPTTVITSYSPSASPTARVIQHQLSFISYADLLASTSTTSVPLGVITQASQEPKSTVLDTAPINLGGSNRGSRRTSFIGNSPRRAGSASPGDLHFLGAEWEREGLRGGLEERLENLLSFESMNKA